MAKRKILFVSKDMGASEMSMPLAELAYDGGYATPLILEGLAASSYAKLNSKRAQAGKPMLPISFSGKKDFRDVPFTLDAEAELKDTKPDAVVVTMSSPINLEDQIGEAANALSIPVVALNDFWGGLTRAKKTKADLMLAIDEADAMAAMNRFSHSYHIAVVGNHAVNKARTLTPSAEIRGKMGELKRAFGTVILFAGGGTDYTGPEIELLVRCLQKTPGSWVVIKRYHGKHMNRTAPDGRTYREVWDEKFAPLADRIIEIPTEEGDAVAALADCAVSGFSTMMTTTVASYKPAISLVTPQTLASLKEQTTLERYPLSVMGLVPEVAEPSDLVPFFQQKPLEVAVDEKLKPYDPALALAEIEKLLKR